MDELIPAPPDHDHANVPVFKLYGYGNVWTTPDLLYCETIADQKDLHDWHVAEHKHVDLLQLVYVEAGGAVVRLDGKAWQLSPGQVVLVPHMVVHEYHFQPHTRGYVLTLTHALLQPLCERFSLNAVTVADPVILGLGDTDADHFVAGTWQRLAQVYRHRHTPQRGALLESLLTILLAWIHDRLQPAGTSDKTADAGSRHMSRFFRMLELHHARQHQVGWYARQLGLTPHHLSEIARAMTGKAALAIIHERLLLAAQRELIYTDRSIGVIAETLGFADPGYFARFFKRAIGVSPKLFRQQTQGSRRRNKPVAARRR